MSDQKSRFLSSEGNQYYQRNHLQLVGKNRDEILLPQLDEAGVRPRAVLEVGCSNGWRLDLMRKKWSAACHGIEPSADAVAKGRELFPAVDLLQGTADRLPYDDGKFDLLVAGFCLYLCDRQDLFRIAAEADRVLADGGHIAILDFHTPMPYRNEYAHSPGLYSYKMDYARLFTWNPAYRLVSQTVRDHDGSVFNGRPDDAIAVSILRKLTESAYPDCPYPRK